MNAKSDVSELEVKLILEAIRLRYGYDFRDYAEASMVRRIEAIVRQFSRLAAPKADGEQTGDVYSVLRRIVQDTEFFHEILPDFTVTTSEMFRDPPFYRALREEVVPVLRTYPRFNIWSAGCSTGEEVFSLAILLQEEGLSERATIYATDINSRALTAAQDGIYPVDTIKTSIKNYIEAGGKESFSEYYTADYGLAKMKADLLSNVVFAEHNLVTDQVFAECHLILCRNVLIYFNKDLQNRVFRLFEESLSHRGFLAIGSKESLRFSSIARSFGALNEKWRLYRKNAAVANRSVDV